MHALGVDIQKRCTLVFGLGALLCGGAGAMGAPLLAVEIGMGKRVLTTVFCRGCHRRRGLGALVGVLLVGTVDSLTHAFLPQTLRSIFSATVTDSLAAGLAFISVYVLMAVVRIDRVRSTGLHSPAIHLRKA